MLYDKFCRQKFRQVFSYIDLLVKNQKQEEFENKALPLDPNAPQLPKPLLDQEREEENDAEIKRKMAARGFG